MQRFLPRLRYPYLFLILGGLLLLDRLPRRMRKDALREIREREKGQEPSYEICIPCDFPFR